MEKVPLRVPLNYLGLETAMTDNRQSANGTPFALQIKNLNVDFLLSAQASAPKSFLSAVDGISLDIRRGETLGLVGESGSGKSVTSFALMDLLDRRSARIRFDSYAVGGEVISDGISFSGLRRGQKIAMIFQEPMTALNPVMTVGAQIAEVFTIHQPEMTREGVQQAAIELLQKVRIADAKERFYSYPHQLSGGMKQRIMIAMALACKPDVLIADEPTTALDVTIQAQILQLIADLQRDSQLSVLFITHDLSVIASICHRVAVMYAGEIVEIATTKELFTRPRHPYTEALLKSSLRPVHRAERLNAIAGQVPTLLERNLKKDSCRFSNRCPQKLPTCELKHPELLPEAKNFVRCLNPVSETVLLKN
jgi:peptide/nickel transport system ATP-binding protein